MYPQSFGLLFWEIPSLAVLALSFGHWPKLLHIVPSLVNQGSLGKSLEGAPWEAQSAVGCQLDFLHRESLPTSPLCKQSPGLLPVRVPQQHGGGWEWGLPV